jgi:hypothetical protein
VTDHIDLLVDLDLDLDLVVDGPATSAAPELGRALLAERGETLTEVLRARRQLEREGLGRELVAEMLAAGAAPLSITEAGEWTTRVLLDPAGNEFCVIGPD